MPNFPMHPANAMPLLLRLMMDNQEIKKANQRWDDDRRRKKAQSSSLISLSSPPSGVLAMSSNAISISFSRSSPISCMLSSR